MSTPSDNTEEITELLDALRGGEQGAFDRLVPVVYEELRRIAHRHLQRNFGERTLNTTALVHETYLKMAGQQRLDAKDQDHLLAISACAMRQVIIQHARARAAAKRGGGQVPVTLDEARTAIDARASELLDLDRILNRLARHDQRLARVVECRYFAGLTDSETARALGVSLRTAQREWQRARAWIREEMKPTAGPES